MSREDAVLALERHATSKISSETDLSDIRWLGFRGEALPSIAAVSRLTLETSLTDGEGTRLRVEGGTLGTVEAMARGRGTTVDVRGLFYNTPARREFLKTPATEQASNVRRLLELALARLEVAWRASHAGREILSLAPARTLAERLAALYDLAYVDTLLPIEAVEEGIAVGGLVQKAAAAGAGRRRQFVFVNGRPIDAPELLQAVLRGYRSAVPAGVRPDVYLFLELDPRAVACSGSARSASPIGAGQVGAARGPRPISSGCSSVAGAGFRCPRRPPRSVRMARPPSSPGSTMRDGSTRIAPRPASGSSTVATSSPRRRAGW
jgi:DNA mismatch repair protein MutL